MPLDRKKDLARCFGQDLMRGEHIVGQAAEQPNINSIFGPAENAGTAASATGTSIFDPVLCEIAYRWFCPPNGLVIDPFAGGSVRGIVASKLGRHYIGVDLRQEQIVANQEQAQHICRDDIMPIWIKGDSTDIISLLPTDTKADFIFSCPPYADLEVYSDNPLDLSTMDYDNFRASLSTIIKNTCSLLKDDRFACFVVGDARDKNGFYYGIPWHTVEAFQNAGLRLYNEAVLVTAVGSLPVRVGRAFSSSRKLGKTHQNVLVFVKGDPRKATEACGIAEFENIEEGHDQDSVTVKISSEMARLPFNGCDPEYIRNTCHASCCHSSTNPSGIMVTIHPSETKQIEARGGRVVDGMLQAVEKRCPFKQRGTELCDLHFTDDKPFGCIASPFTLTSRNTLIVRNRYKMLRCFDDGRKLPAYIAFRSSLDMLFGNAEADRICSHLDAGGGDISASMPIKHRNMLVENDEIKRSHSRSG